VVIETRHSAQIVAPCDGWVTFAGEHRSYGLLVIINAGEGYHFVLAGLGETDVQAGQYVLVGEPVGTMPKDATRPQPVLYLELRKDGQAIDPALKLQRN
jgi:septal ring factor EnvC (AmiA/AmiB activator)